MSRRIVRVVLAAAIVLALTVLAAAQTTRVPSAPLYLELVVNSVPTGRVVPVTTRQGDYFVGRDDLRAASIPLPDDAAEWVAPVRLTGVQVGYDAYGQRLLLRVPPEWLPRQAVRVSPRPARIPADTAHGLVINYDTHAQHTSTDTYAAAGTEVRLFGPWGAISSTGASRWSDSTGRLRSVRHDTLWTYADEGRAVRYAAGDVITGSLPWTRALRLGGFSVSRQFGIRPDLVTHPLPELSGQTAVPTGVDLFINGARSASANLAPGPYTFTDMPLVSGAGTATIVTTDVLGRRSSRDVSFYVANDLLRPGLTDFSVTVGALRRDFGLRSWSYAGPAAVGTIRVGVTRALTVNAHAEGSHRVIAGSAGADLRVARWGVLTGAATHGHQPFGQGWLLAGTYRYTAARVSVQLRHEQRTAAFAGVSDVSPDGLLDAARPRRVDHATGAVSLGRRWGVVAAGFFDVRGGAAMRSQIVNLSYNRPTPGGTSLLVGLNAQLGQPVSHTALIRLIVPIGSAGTASVSASQTGRDETVSQLQYSRSAPPDGGLGWHLALADQREAETRAELTLRTRPVQMRGGTYGDRAQRTYWAGAAGAAIVIGGQVFAANQASDAFVLVDTNGHADVPVMLENQPVGSTDRRGQLLIPGVPSHYAAKVSIDPMGLASDIQVPLVDARVAVRRQSGAIVRFAMTRVLAALVTLVDRNGRPLPVGARVVHLQTGRAVPVGWDGLVYLDGLASENDVVVWLPEGGTCRVRFVADADTRGIPRIGPLSCRP